MIYINDNEYEGGWIKNRGKLESDGIINLYSSNLMKHDILKMPPFPFPWRASVNRTITYLSPPYKFYVYRNRPNLSRLVGKIKDVTLSCSFTDVPKDLIITSHYYSLSVHLPAAGRDLRLYHILRWSHAWRILGSTWRMSDRVYH
jgi:hypothetical protein